MKVIFLDIDGVMNSNEFYRRRHHTLSWRARIWFNRLKAKLGFKYKSVDFSNDKILKKWNSFEKTFPRLLRETDKQKWKWLSEFCNEHGYKICISSVWRSHFEPKDGWKLAFLRLGFDGGTYIGTTGRRRSCRGEEIKEWLETSKYNHLITDYAIIDDDSDMLDEQKEGGHFFHVDGWYGLSPNTLYKINRFFNKQ